MVTHAEIAAKVGVSKSAVSFALRGMPNVSPANRARIRKAARELGYRPNPLIAAHMAQLRSLKPPKYQATIAYVFDGTDRSPDEVELQNRYFAGCSRRGDELGYRVERFDTSHPELSPPYLSRILTSRGIQGLVIAPLCAPKTSLKLAWSRFSAAALGYSLHSPRLHRACHHNFLTMERLVVELVRRGYRRIGLAMAASADTRVNHLWFASYLAQCHWTPGLAQIPPLIEAEWHPSALQDWIERHRLDAIISSTTTALKLLEELGWKIPRNLGFANVFWTRSAPNCFGIDQDFERVGAAAIDLVVGQLNANERGLPAHPKVVLVDGKIVPGRTVRQLARTDRTAG